MSRSNLVLGVIAGVALLLAGWMWLEKRGVEDDLSSAKRTIAEHDASAAKPDPWATAGTAGPRATGVDSAKIGDGPALAPQVKETKMERRARWTREIAAMFGRAADESEEDYKARIVPLMQLYLDKPRIATNNRKVDAYAAANVTAEQAAKLDGEFTKVYDDVVAYTNQAIADGQVSPYSRNVAGMLQYAGGLGAILTDAEGRIGKVLSSQQLKTMYDMGFEWSEYLGLNAPWEKLNAPPPGPGGGGS